MDEEEEIEFDDNKGYHFLIGIISICFGLFWIGTGLHMYPFGTWVIISMTTGGFILLAIGIWSIRNWHNII